MMRILSGAALALLVLPLIGQEPSTPPAATKPQDPVADMLQVFRDNGLTVDAEAKTITVPCEIVREQDPLEFLLIEPRGKSHEALFVTRCKPSVLNAAFLLLGYQPGKNASIVERDPPPTQEEIEQGAPLIDVLPPDGEQVWFTVRWQQVDDDGEERAIELPVEDLILDMTTGRTVEGADWIYLGGQMAPIYRNEDPVFVADFEGNHVSVVYKEPPNHLVTMRHALANDDQVWWRTDLTPDPGTPCELIVHKAKTPLHVARDARLAEERQSREAAEQPAPPDGEPRNDREVPR